MLREAETHLNPDDLRELASKWRALETTATNVHFFTSWHWIGSWLATCAIKPRLVEFFEGDRLVGLACYCESRFSRMGLVWRQANINRTGLPNQDQIWIEYNDALAADGYQESVRKSLVGHLVAQPSITEVRLGLSAVDDFAASCIQNCQREFESQGYLLELKPEFGNRELLLRAFSSNTRNQLRRAFKAYSNQGIIDYQVAETAEQALGYFSEAGRLHKEKWGDSGFHNPVFVAFHQHLIKSAFSSGCIGLIRVRVGERVIAYLYNFLFRGRVYFYLSGIDYDAFTGNRFKPGLIAHVISMTHYAKDGMDIYDFMAGDARYKKSLSNVSYPMALLSLKKKNVKTVLYSLLKRLKVAL